MDDFKPIEIVVTGARYGANHVKVLEIGILDDDGQITETKVFKHVRKVTGGIYTGCSINELGTKLRGLDACKFKELWPVAEQRLKWEMEERNHMQMLSGHKLQKKIDNRRGEMLTLMLPLRIMYLTANPLERHEMRQAVISFLEETPTAEELR